MKAMLLAAGYGTRLRPLTDRIPKPLLPIGKYPLLVWNLILLKRHGIREAIINLHYLGDQIVEALGDGARYGMRLAYSHEPNVLGTGGGIKQAAPYLREEAFVVLNGDTLSDCDLTSLINAHRNSGALATLALREDARADEWGRVALDASARIVQITGIPPQAAARATAMPYMFAGIHVLEPAVLDKIPSDPCSIIDTYIEMLHREELLTGFPIKGYWSDVGTPERYATAQQDVANGRFSLAGSEG
jgi:NDP-sugar pyrophosphorylase family protein